MPELPLPSEFDRSWAGPEELKPRCYRAQIEKDIWMGCVVHDEYRCPQFAPSDLVIDIGGHIGAFAYKAWLNGSRNVHSFELNPWHHEGAQVNLEGCDGVQLHNAAVVRSDALRRASYTIDEGGWSNLRAFARGEPVASISLDEIIARYGCVRFLKTDCEGSEWPILYTASRLHEVQEIAGEYHDDVAGPEVEGFVTDPARLCAHLATFGFTTEFEPMSARRVGLFRAWR